MASIYETERGNSCIIVGGVRMTLNEYKKKQKEEKAATEKKATRRKKKETKELNAVAQEVESLIKPITVLKSLSAYYDNAYRQWGNVANLILQLREIRSSFVFYRVKVSELERLIAEIQKIANRNEKAAFQYVEKLSWKLDDIKTELRKLMSGVSKSGICDQLKNHEAINGNGRRLGLQTLMKKAYKAIESIESAIKRLNQIVDEGVDIMTYENHLSFKAKKRVLC